MADTGWNEILDEVIRICSPTAYKEFAREIGSDFAEGNFALDYHITPLFLLTSGIYHEALALPDADLTSIAAGLERVWQTVLEERDTSVLPSDHDEEEDEYLVDELENLRDEADGVLAALEAYVAGDGLPEDDVNALIQQASLKILSNHHQARRLFGQAGAAILRGANYWPLWHVEIEQSPLDTWVRGLFGLVALIKLEDHYPLPAVAEQRQRISAGDSASAPDDIPNPAELSPAEQRLMKLLLSGRETLSDKEIAGVAFTPDIIKRLKIVVQSDDYAFEESEGKGYAPIHAAKLLGLSGSPEAVDSLLLALYKSDPDDILYSTVSFALEALGPLALPAVLESMQYSTDLDFRLAVAGVLATIGKGDDRAFHVLEAYYHETTWDDDRVMAVCNLGMLGDPRGLPILQKALNDRDITPMGINETIASIEALDPNHNPEELKRLEAKARQRYDSRLVRFDKYGQAFCRDCGSLMQKGPLGDWMHVEPEPLAPSSRASRPPFPAFNPPLPVDPRFKNVSRNDPCPCGSGKKFKHCHGSGKERVN